MDNSYFFIALLLCIALALTFFFPVPAALADDHCWVEYAWVDCDDGNLFNGYWWRGEGFVPGMITRQTHFLSAPPFTTGWAVYYAQGVMEATARYRGLDLSDYVDGVAMMSCADIGQTIWIQRSGFREWEGPFLVVDCAEWDDHYPIAMFRGEVVEVGWETAVRWEMVLNGGADDLWREAVFVLKSRFRPPDDLRYYATLYRDWFKETARFASHYFQELRPRYYYTWRSEKLVWVAEGGRERKGFLAWQDNPMYIEPWIRDLIYRIGD